MFDQGINMVSVNSFTDTNAVYPFQSSEATNALGIPDAPEIHLAITSLAQWLLGYADQHSINHRNLRVQALRTASYGVLNHSPLAAVVARFRINIDDELLTQDEVDQALAKPHVDWLGQAVKSLRASGVVIKRDFRSQSSAYGWLDLDPHESAPDFSANDVEPGP